MRAASRSPTRCSGRAMADSTTPWARQWPWQARQEGLLLDPVYTGKAMAGLIAHVRSGRIAAGSRVLFIHTGGQPALFAYGDSLGPWLSEAPDGPAR